MISGPAIDVRDVRKSFDGVGIVRGVDLRVEQGEIFGFLGINGSGKATFLRTPCELLKAQCRSGIARLEVRRLRRIGSGPKADA